MNETGLTEKEHEAMRVTGELANLLSEIIGKGPTRAQDINEIAGHLHAIQHAIMAQAAARLDPDLYRLLGETLSEGVYEAAQEKVAWYVGDDKGKPAWPCADGASAVAQVMSLNARRPGSATLLKRPYGGPTEVVEIIGAPG